MVNKTRDETSGQFAAVYEERAFLDAIRERGGMASTRQTADAVGCDKDTAYRRLRSLVEEGELDSENIGNTILWSVRDS